MAHQNDLQVLLTSAKAGELTMEMIGEAHFDFDAADDYIHDVISRKPRLVTVDLARLTFISSVGIFFLINLRKAVLDRGASFAVRGFQPQVRQVLEHARVLDMFEQASEG